MTTSDMNNSIAMPDSAKKQKSARAALIRARIIQYTVLTFCTLLVVAPFFIILITSLHTKADALQVPFRFIGQDGLSIEGYKAFFDYGLYWQGLLNTLILSVVPTIVGLFASAAAAFAYAKLRWRLRGIFFAVLIFTMMVPATILLVPHYMMYSWFGWTNIDSAANFLPLIVPSLFGGAGTIFFLRQFLFGIPDSLIEAGKIDGLSYPGIFVLIVVPLMVPALLAQGLLGFINHYNAYLGPLLYLKTPDYYSLQLIVATFKDNVGTNYPAQMASCIITITPILVLYVVFQKYFVEGIATSGMKL